MKISRKALLINLGFLGACLIALLLFIQSPKDMFSNEGFMPHGHCYLWSPTLVWTMVTTDLLIGLAYISISVCLYVLVRRIRLPFSAMFLAFGVFIAACGGTHFMGIYTLWYPNYWLDAFVKAITAIASVATAILVYQLFPKVIEFATAARLSGERKLQLEVMNRELEARTEQLVLANRELEAFSYSVSHDLRTPLRGIDGFSKALLEDYAEKLDAEGTGYLNHIRSGAQRMGQIIDDLLNLSRITRTELNHHQIDLSKLAKDAIEHLSQQEPGRKVEVFIQEGASASGDLGLLRLVVDNLISNAWKFTAKSIAARIEFGAKRDGGKTIYFVRDNGIGFDMTYVEKLFGAFQRLHSVEDYAGTGVGLATAKRIIERHNGRIWAESVVGKGTTFYFSVGG
jgi:signal transduction histidine kinase